jgi:hypothetical protein
MLVDRVRSPDLRDEQIPSLHPTHREGDAVDSLSPWNRIETEEALRKWFTNVFTR